MKLIRLTVSDLGLGKVKIVCCKLILVIVVLRIDVLLRLVVRRSELNVLFNVVVVTDEISPSTEKGNQKYNKKREQGLEITSMKSYVIDNGTECSTFRSR